MSHYVLLVTNTDKEPLDDQLSPYYEESEDSPFLERDYYLKRNEKEINDWLDKHIKDDKEFLKKYSSDNGEPKPMMDLAYLDSVRDRLAEWEQARGTNSIDEKLAIISEQEGGEVDSEGIYYLCNAEAKWDWYSIGGRWNKWLVDKKGKHCNKCRVKNVDFEKMRQGEVQLRGEIYDAEIKRAKEAGREPMIWGYDKFPTREEFTNAVPEQITPYAILHNGEWCERAQMVLCKDYEKTSESDVWEKKFLEIFESLDPETQITVVDCHI